MKDKTLSTVMVIGILTTMPLSANANGWEMTAVDTSGWNADYEKAIEAIKSLDAAWE